MTGPLSVLYPRDNSPHTAYKRQPPKPRASPIRLSDPRNVSASLGAGQLLQDSMKGRRWIHTQKLLTEECFVQHYCRSRAQTMANSAHDNFESAWSAITYIAIWLMWCPNWKGSKTTPRSHKATLLHRCHHWHPYFNMLKNEKFSDFFHMFWQYLLKAKKTFEYLFLNISIALLTLM